MPPGETGLSGCGNVIIRYHSFPRLPCGDGPLFCPAPPSGEEEGEEGQGICLHRVGLQRLAVACRDASGAPIRAPSWGFRGRPCADLQVRRLPRIGLPALVSPPYPRLLSTGCLREVPNPDRRHAEASPDLRLCPAGGPPLDRAVRSDPARTPHPFFAVRADRGVRAVVPFLPSGLDTALSEIGRGSGYGAEPHPSFDGCRVPCGHRDVDELRVSSGQDGRLNGRGLSPTADDALVHIAGDGPGIFHLQVQLQSNLCEAEPALFPPDRHGLGGLSAGHPSSGSLPRTSSGGSSRTDRSVALSPAGVSLSARQEPAAADDQSSVLP